MVWKEYGTVSRTQVVADNEAKPREDRPRSGGARGGSGGGRGGYGSRDRY